MIESREARRRALNVLARAERTRDQEVRNTLTVTSEFARRASVKATQGATVAIDRAARRFPQPPARKQS